ncbi:TPA: hypothetical protein N0F65_011781 [Lagenidium giganteum]|uniref:Uncharacterized protein n=1 Tax=Lagenidium giganteum TaxID=4803 RepID=A0AAV2YJT2_9STRA|nr:TPA: hypothetical protein N0F65_011781 [Lagenidium giganteum]
MVQDVIKFIVLYGVFQIGFSGSFYLLFLHEQSRYNSYGEAFLATFLMLFGALIRICSCVLKVQRQSWQMFWCCCIWWVPW